MLALYYYRFVFTFQLAMALSITAMPLYFKSQNAVSVYGMAYSAMAITGGFSFIYGQWVDKLGYAKALIIGTLLYAIALMLRLITHPVIAVMVVVLAGIGACMALLSIQNWTAHLSDNKDQNTTKLAATRRLISQSASLIGTGSVSALIVILGESYQKMLLLAGVLAMGSVLLLPAFLSTLKGITLTKPNKTIPPIAQKIKPPTLKQRWLSLNTTAYLLLGYTLLIGIYTGLLKPYVMLLLIDYGVSESLSVLVYFTMTAASMLIYALMIGYNKKLQSIFIQGFFANEVVTTFIYLMMGYALLTKLSVWLVVALMLLKNAVFSIGSTFSEISEYQLIDKNKLAVLLGFSQTLFLIGDALGSLITGLVLTPNSPKDYALLCFCCGMIAFINTLIIARLKKYARVI